MNAWIIILTAIGAACLLFAKGLENYIKNDKEELVKAYYNLSNKAIIAGLARILGVLMLFADGILVLIKLLN